MQSGITLIFTGIPDVNLACESQSPWSGIERVIDIAVKHGYSSADAFSRAFGVMHGITPSEARKKGVSLKAQPKVTFTLSSKGLLEMNYKIVEKESFKVVGIKDRFSHLDNLGASVGNMWASTPQETIQKIMSLSNVEPTALIGAYSEMYDDNTTDYYIGTITANNCSSDFVTLEVPAETWAIFEIVGALPTAMENIWGRIFSEWFPATGYEHSKAPEIEWYSAGDMSSETYKSEIWIPVVKR